MNKNAISIQIVNWEQHQTEIRLIRKLVFITEQHVPEEMEWDGLDEEAIHILAIENGKHPVGTARLLSNGQIGRMAVLADYRNQGIGSAMLGLLINYAEKHINSLLFLNAQIHAADFYQRHGFKCASEIFMEAGIPHYKMIHAPG